jgi:hypothetical protein
VAALVALAGCRVGGGMIAFQFLAAPFRTGAPSRPDAVYSGRAYVLSTGSVVLAGRAPDLLDDEAIRKACLG